MLILYSKLMRNVAALAVFNTIKWRLLIVAYFLGHAVYPKKLLKFILKILKSKNNFGALNI